MPPAAAEKKLDLQDRCAELPQMQAGRSGGREARLAAPADGVEAVDHGFAAADGDHAHQEGLQAAGAAVVLLRRLCQCCLRSGTLRL